MADIINACFELISGLLMIINIVALYKDKKVRGVRILPTIFFVTWGYWNLYFYNAVDCWWSFLGGILLVTTNSIWVGQMIYYNYKEKHPKQYTEEELLVNDLFHGVIHIPKEWRAEPGIPTLDILDKIRKNDNGI